MVRECHNQWHGYTKVVVPDMPKPKAQCNQCNKVMSKTDAEFLRIHREEKCEKVKEKKKAKQKPSASVNEKRFSRVSVESPHNQPFMNPDSSDCSTEKEPESIVSVSRFTKDKQKKILQCDNALLKMFATLDLDFSLIESKPFLNFLSILNSDYKPPTTEELRTITMTSAHNACLGSQHDLKSAFLMGAFTLEDNNKYLIVTFIIKNSKLFYVDAGELLYDHQINDNVKLFLIKSLENCIQTYKARIEIILFQSNILVDREFKFSMGENENSEMCKVYLYYSFRLTLDNISLKLEGNDENFEELSNFLNKWEKKINQKCTLSEAVSDIVFIHKKSNASIDLEAVITEEMKYFLQPVALVSYYMDHRFKGEGLLEIDTYRNAMMKNLYVLIPEEAITALSLYVDYVDPFTRPVFEEAKVLYSPSRFWKLVQLEKVSDQDIDLKQLGSFADRYISLPASLKKFDVDSVKRIFTAKLKQNDMLTAVVGCAVLND